MVKARFKLAKDYFKLAKTIQFLVKINFKLAK